MAWFTRITRFGDVHIVYGQEHNRSCGLACIMMCVFKLNKLRPGAASLTTENDIIKAYESAVNSKFNWDSNAFGGADARFMPRVLDQFTSGSWQAHNAQPTTIPRALIDKVGVTGSPGPVINVEPVIMRVAWNPVTPGTNPGAHFVVVDTIREFMGTYYATICDPWDSNVHIQPFSPGGTFVYDASSSGFMCNLFGTPPKAIDYPYGSANKGQVKQWGLIDRS